MMERLIRDCDYPYAMLDTQYRMHPEIRDGLRNTTMAEN